MTGADLAHVLGVDEKRLRDIIRRDDLLRAFTHRARYVIDEETAHRIAFHLDVSALPGFRRLPLPGSGAVPWESQRKSDRTVGAGSV